MAGKWKPPPGWAAIREQVFLLKGRKCHWCGRDADTVDHVLARCLGGGHELGNLVPSCRGCNFRRGAEIGNRLRSARARRVPVPLEPPPAQWTPSRDW